MKVVKSWREISTGFSFPLLRCFDNTVSGFERQTVEVCEKVYKRICDIKFEVQSDQILLPDLVKLVVNLVTKLRNLVTL